MTRYVIDGDQIHRSLEASPWRRPGEAMVVCDDCSCRGSCVAGLAMSTGDGPGSASPSKAYRFSYSAVMDRFCIYMGVLVRFELIVE